jgi:two-component system chemotaxis sensor kinase CheA
MANNEILREFLLETHENLALLDSDLVKLESHPDDKATLAQVFRTLHSVKGTAGFMGLLKLQAVAHSAESLLGRLRAGEIRFNRPIATALLGVVDAVREMMANIESAGGEGSTDYTVLVAEVERLRKTGGGESAITPALEKSPPVVRLPLSRPDQPSPNAPLAGEPTTSELTPGEARVAAGDPRPGGVADAAIRVDVGLLDKLMNLVGELVLARNQILQQCEMREDGLGNVVQRLNQLTTELQASVMKTRMQPIGNVLGKFPRIVRDLSLACGKKVRFEMEGQDTELDKTLIEAIRDPLTHMIRNAVDHGIEPPHDRATRGKPEEGRLRVVAFHEGGKVIVEIHDDGAGIDAARVRDKALSAGLVSPEAAARMSPQELQRLVFLPGFSTAERVTQFSGRGVGMDVVRTNIEKIGGSVDLESTPGQGTTIRTKIPLTLAIVPALIVTAGGERFAIPQVSLLELVRLEAERVSQEIERLHGALVYRLRGVLLPLVFLDEQLELNTLRGQQDDLNIVVLQADERPFGLVVDAIRDTEEIVVKPLQQELRVSRYSPARRSWGTAAWPSCWTWSGWLSGRGSSPAFRTAASPLSKAPRGRPQRKSTRSCCLNPRPAGKWPFPCRSCRGWKSPPARGWSNWAAGRSCSTAKRSCRCWTFRRNCRPWPARTCRLVVIPLRATSPSRSSFMPKRVNAWA